MIRMKQKQEEQEYCVETDKKGHLKCVKRLKKKQKNRTTMHLNLKVPR